MPGVLTTEDVTEFRDLVHSLGMPDTFTLTRDTSASDGAGGSTTTTATVASGWCRLREAGSGTERTIADRLGYQTPYAVDIHPDVDVRSSDRLVVNGRTLEIGSIVEAGVWRITQTAIVQEVG